MRTAPRGACSQGGGACRALGGARAVRGGGAPRCERDGAADPRGRDVGKSHRQEPSAADRRGRPTVARLARPTERCAPSVLGGVGGEGRAGGRRGKVGGRREPTCDAASSLVGEKAGGACAQWSGMLTGDGHQRESLFAAAFPTECLGGRGAPCRWPSLSAAAAAAVVAAGSPWWSDGVWGSDGRADRGGRACATSLTGGRGRRSERVFAPRLV